VLVAGEAGMGKNRSYRRWAAACGGLIHSRPLWWMSQPRPARVAGNRPWRARRAMEVR
jgi:hypothetical protein